MQKMISDETAVTAMYVYEVFDSMLDHQPKSHPIHEWRSKIGITEMRFQAVALASEIDALYNSFADNELDGVLFDEDFVPIMLREVDFASADQNNPPKLRGTPEEIRQNVIDLFNLASENSPKP